MICTLADTRSDNRAKILIQAVYISIAAILGVLTRMILAQLFGEACANPGTVGWLSAASPLCVTNDGTTTQKGGIVFADLPSNILGSFLMGFFQDYTVLGLAIPMAVAWLPPSASFQRCGILHVAFRTGFCGSLTTFSSWNSEMIVMLYGTGSTQSARFIKVVLGYIIGMETAAGSFDCGCSLARRIHRFVNPKLAAEGAAMQRREEEGVFINRSLPNFERRFLHLLDLGIVYNNDLSQTTTDDRIQSLEKWRKSTELARRIRHPQIEILKEVEDQLLVQQERTISKQLDLIARSNEWDVDSLYHWIEAKSNDIAILPTMSSSIEIQTNEQCYGPCTSFVESHEQQCGKINRNFNDGVLRYTQPMKPQSKPFKLIFAIVLVSAILAFLLISLCTLTNNDAVTITNRTMVYSMLIAPTGALLRWHLSTYNGGRVQWEYCSNSFNSWFPYGTYFANLVGSLFSILSIAIEYKLEQHGVNSFWTIGTLRAFRIGFCGCLTTVSTFAAEVSSFMRTKTDHAYPYIFISLGSCATIGMVLYGLVVFV
jgi:fluoride ion exporter CrcB/FEX